ncbi:Sorting nexin, cytoplasm-to-vacuole targeting pathway/endosomal sorting [Gonapodya sp. JEL0774]|nr:Sorting nexin, cytoplasm-to-vacuole targeting pathway/endosomal sorting [Gonapodya sp. JEL0774]
MSDDESTSIPDPLSRSESAFTETSVAPAWGNSGNSRPFMSPSTTGGFQPSPFPNSIHPAPSSTLASASASAMNASAASFLTADAYTFSGGFADSPQPYRPDSNLRPSGISTDSLSGLGSSQSSSVPQSQSDSQHPPAPVAAPPPTIPEVPPKPTFCCATHKALDAFAKSPADAANPNILIADAQKTTDMTNSTYIVYIIRTIHPTNHLTLLEVKRRYSDFDSLRRSLAKIHPCLIVPPIPEKHSLADYAVGQARARDDVHVIAKRKRMLQAFLNRVARHPVLGAEHMFHRFLEQGSWNEVLTTTTVPADGGKSVFRKALDKRRVKIPDPHWTNSERYTANYSDAISIAHRATKRVLTDLVSLSSSLSDLGATYNAWSLHESALAPACEKIGQACEAQQRAVGTLVAGVEEGFSEPLQEQGEFAVTVAKVLRWRKDKQVELEGVVEQLEQKRAELAKLERNETEAQRLQSVLNYHGETSSYVATGDRDRSDTSGGPQGGSSAIPPPAISNSLPQPPPIPRPTSLLATINSLLDNDPQSTRRSSIARLRDKLIQLDDSRRTKTDEVEAAGGLIQEDLDRYQREKLKDLALMMAAYGRVWREYARRGAMAWEEVVQEVAKVQGGD